MEGTTTDDATTFGGNGSNSPPVEYVQYTPEKEAEYLKPIRALIAKDLSEPYSIYVYRYFLYQWPELCFIALDARSRELIGVVINKLEQHRGGPMRGYIAMLAVVEEHRGKGIATALVRMSIEAIKAADADEVALETEITNTASLKLYERLGFLRSKRLHRYYLNGNTAFRLLLYLKPGTALIKTTPPDYGAFEGGGGSSSGEHLAHEQYL